MPRLLILSTCQLSRPEPLSLLTLLPVKQLMTARVKRAMALTVRRTRWLPR